MRFLFAFKNYIKIHWLCVIFIFLIALFRFSLINTGHLFWIDELRYVNAFAFVKHLMNANFNEAIKALFNAHGRPGFVLFSSIPATVQIILHNIGWMDVGNPLYFQELMHFGRVSAQYNHHYFDLPSAVNVMVSLSISLLFYHFILEITKDRTDALIGTVVYSLLVNSYFYVRHMVPYDYALLMLFLALFFVIRQSTKALSSKMIVGVGMLSALGFITYPSYYLLVFLIAALILTLSRKKFKQTALFALSFCLSVFLFECISWIVGKSFYQNTTQLLGAVTQGSFEEGFIFLYRYMRDVEGGIGICILTLFLIFVFVYLRKASSACKVLFVTVVAGYLFYGAMSVFYHRVVFYGRLLHMYIPFLVLGAVLFINMIKPGKVKYGIIVVTLILSMASFIRPAVMFAKLQYPREFEQRHLSLSKEFGVYRAIEHQWFNENELLNYGSLIVNAYYLDYIPDETFPVKDPKYMTLVKSVDHPMNFPAYQYEGYSVSGREKIRKRNYQMKIYANTKLLQILIQKETQTP